MINYPVVKKQESRNRNRDASHSLVHGLKCRNVSRGIFIKLMEIWDTYISKGDTVSETFRII